MILLPAKYSNPLIKKDRKAIHKLGEDMKVIDAAVDLCMNADLDVERRGRMSTAATI